MLKVFLMTTEDWQEIYDGIKEAENFLKQFNVSFKVKKIDLDVTNPLFYHTSTSWSWLKQKQTKSFHGAAIRSLGESFGGKDYDYYGLVVDKAKSLEDNSLYGQHESKFKTIEVYAKKTKKKYYGLSYVGYNLVHETLHALASFNNVEDTLHQYLVDNKKLQGYMEQLQSKVHKLVINNGIDKGLKGGTNVPKEIIVHHTSGSDKNILADTSHHGFEMVKKLHKGKGWQTIGYHYFIEKDGKIWQGRPDDMEGAHCVGKNRTSIGICLAGNFDFSKPTEPQMVSLKSLIGHLKAKYSISKIEGHRKYASKTCPGKNFTDAMIKAL